MTWSLVHTVFFFVKTLHLGTVSVRLAWSSPLPRYRCCVDCLYCDLDTCFFVSSLKLETGDPQELEIRGFPYHWSRSNGSVSFTMSSGGQESYSFIPRWNEETATLESFDQRVKLFESSTKKEKRYLCGPRVPSAFDPEGDTIRCVRDNLTDVQLEAADGSGALMIVKTFRLSVCPQSGSCSVVVGCLQSRSSSTTLW